MKAIAEKKTKNVPGILKNGIIIAKPGTQVELPLWLIKRNTDQPREFFDKVELKKLANSYRRRKNVEYPLMVSLSKNGTHVIIIDGERRWRAAKLGKLASVSCNIRPPMTTDEMFLVSAKANLCREDMTMAEEAKIIKRLMEKHDMTINMIAEELGKHVSQIYQTLSFFKLSKRLQDMLSKGKIKKGTALVIAKYPEKEQVRMLGVIKDAESKRGNGNGSKPIHPNDANRLLKKFAQQEGIEASKGRGRNNTSHEELVAKHLATNLRNLGLSLDEFMSIPKKALPNLGSVHFTDIEKDIEKIIKKGEKLLSRLRLLD